MSGGRPPRGGSGSEPVKGGASDAGAGNVPPAAEELFEQSAGARARREATGGTPNRPREGTAWSNDAGEAVRGQEPGAGGGVGAIDDGSLARDSGAAEGAGELDADIGSTAGGVGGGGGVLRAGQPVRQLGSPPRPTDTSAPEPSRRGGMVIAGPRPEDVDPRAERRAERLVASLFLLSAAGTVLFIWAYTFAHIHTSDYGLLQNVLLALGLTLALGGIGAAIVVWGKRLMPHESAVQERHPFHSEEAEREKTNEVFFGGVEATGIARRSLIRRSAALALGLLGLPAIVALRDLGPAPGTSLRHTPWRKGVRLVDLDTHAPIKLGDLAVGAVKTVMPEGFEKQTEEQNNLAPTLLIRMRPEELRKTQGPANWSPDGHVAYSKICTHAGCPISLYEQQTHHLLCPCHQSTFLVNEGCRVIFGPAARALPQLAITVDEAGYFVAQGPYREPVGPSFWERG